MVVAASSCPFDFRMDRAPRELGVPCFQFEGPMEPSKQNSLKKYVVVLSQDERAKLEKMLDASTLSSRIAKRCKTLLRADEGLSDVQIAADVNCSINCVANLRKRFVTEGIERAIYDAHRSGAPNKFTNEQLIAIKELASSEPPADRTSWTLQLLRKEAVARGIVKSISIGRMHALIKDNLNSAPKSASSENSQPRSEVHKSNGQVEKGVQTATTSQV